MLARQRLPTVCIYSVVHRTFRLSRGSGLTSERPSAWQSGLTKNLSKGRRRYLCLWRHALLVAAFAIGVGYLIDASDASAAVTAAGQTQIKTFPMAQIFTFLFLMLGPFKIIEPFSRITKGADTKFIRGIALLSTLFSSLALLIAGLFGELFLHEYGIPPPVLALSAAIIVFLVALLNILKQFALPTSQSEGPVGPTPTSQGIFIFAYARVLAVLRRVSIGTVSLTEDLGQTE
jgi:hypothetical protein